MDGLARRAVLSALLWLLALGIITTSAWADADIPKAVGNQILTNGTANIVVTFSADESKRVPRSPAALKARKAEIGGLTDELVATAELSSKNKLRRFGVFPMAALQVDGRELAKIAKMNTVVGISDAPKMKLALAESGGIVGATRARETGSTGAGQTVAILDSGVDYTHPAFGNRVVDGRCYTSTDANNSCDGAAVSYGVHAGRPAACRPDTPTGCIHGTHVAGIAAGGQAPYYGVAPGANIVSVRIAEGSGYVRWDASLLAMDFIAQIAQQYNIVALNYSIGTGPVGPADTYCDAQERTRGEIDAIQTLRALNVATVAASGNDAGAGQFEFEALHKMGQPACYSNAVSVAATTKQDAMAYYANRSGVTSLVAPGTGITSAEPGGGYRTLSGTSMAAPHVTGAWAVARQRFGNISVSDVLAYLRGNAVTINDPMSGLSFKRLNIPSPPPPAPRIGRVTPCGELYTQEGASNAGWMFHFGCPGAVQETALSTSRIGMRNGCGAVYTKSGPLDGLWEFHFGCNTARSIQMTESRFAVVTRCGGLQVKEGRLDTLWNTVRPCGTTRAVAMAGNRLAIIDNCGAVYTQEGALNGPFQLHFGCGSGRAIAMTSTRFGVVTNCGGLEMKEGSLSGLWNTILPCGNARAIALHGDRMALIDGCGGVQSKEGAITAGWYLHFGCNHSKAVFVSPSRFGAVTNCDSVQMKEGALNSLWFELVPCGSASGISIGCDDGSCMGTVPTAETAITSGPANGTSVPGNVSVGFSSEISGATFECKLDAGQWNACSSPYTATLANGQHTVSVRATDWFGPDPTPETRTFTVIPPDTVAPVVSVTSPGTAATADTTPPLGMTIQDVSPISTVSCRVDSGTAFNCASGNDLPQLAVGSHTLTVTATDAASNVGTASRSFAVDTTPPETTISSGPANGSSVSDGHSVTFGFSSGTSGVTYSCRVDSGSFATCVSPYKLPSLSIAKHTFEVRAVKSNGLVDATPATRVFDVGPPGLAFVESTTSIPNSAIQSLTANDVLDWAHWGYPDQFSTVRSQFEQSLVGSLTAVGGATLNRITSGIMGVSWTDGYPIGNTPGDGSAVWTGGATGRGMQITVVATNTNARLLTVYLAGLDVQGKLTATMSDGSVVMPQHLITFPAGTPASYAVKIPYRSTAPTATLTLQWVANSSSAGSRVHMTAATVGNLGDTVAPDTTITSGPAQNGYSTITNPSFGFSSEAGARFWCKYDANAFAACTSPLASTLTQGSHTFMVRAQDAAGNVDPTPAVRTFTVDNVAPDTTITSGPANGAKIKTTSATYAFSSPDATATFECKIDTAAYAPCTSPKTWTGLTRATHTVTFRAIDPAGNIDATPATRTVTVT